MLRLKIALRQILTLKKMKRIILVFGLILGSILCVNLVIMVDQCYHNPDFMRNDVMGYTAMVLIFSLIFFGIRNYRNGQLHGYISFGKGLKTGALIALTASTLYVIFWLFYYYLFVPDFLDKYIPHVLKDAGRKGAEQLASAQKEMEGFRAMYKNPLFVIMITYAEVLPVGLVVALVSSLILKKKPKQA